MAKEIDKIIQSKTAPKSNNVLWDDGENLKINRNGKWESTSSDFMIRRSDFLNKTPRAFKLANIIKDNYLGYDKEYDDNIMDFSKIPSIRIFVDQNVAMVESDTVSTPHLVIPSTICLGGILHPDNLEVFLLNICGYNYYQNQHYNLQFSIVCDSKTEKVIDMECTWNYTDNA